MSQYTVDTSQTMSACLVACEEPTRPPRPSCTYPPNMQGTCMFACQLPKFKTNALPSSLQAFDPPARTRQPTTSSPTTHSLASSRSFDLSLYIPFRLCIISRPAFLATSFTLFSSANRFAPPRRGRYIPPPEHYLPAQPPAFLRHRRSGFTKKRLGTLVATPRVLG